ncbi:MAG: hypothetical protein IPP79_11575 [Chitinophagaceae bacterium]|nr:hypothetical protein [Chitinophagaceae bacterium]
MTQKLKANSTLLFGTTLYSTLKSTRSQSSPVFNTPVAVGGVGGNG